MSAKYNKNLKPLARNLRKFGTKGEALLWRDVFKAKQHWPYQFNRQFIIGDYIVDFICRNLKLIIEIDGSSHIAKSEEDLNGNNFWNHLDSLFCDLQKVWLFTGLMMLLQRLIMQFNVWSRRLKMRKKRNPNNFSVLTIPLTPFE